MTNKELISAEAAELFDQRDVLLASMREVDARLRELRAGYMQEARVWGISMERFQQEAQMHNKVAA